MHKKFQHKIYQTINNILSQRKFKIIFIWFVFYVLFKDQCILFLTTILWASTKITKIESRIKWIKKIFYCIRANALCNYALCVQRQYTI